MNWVDYLVPFGTAGGGAASVYGLVVRPRQKEHMRHEAVREERRRANDAFLNGVQGIEGVSETVLPAASRLQGVQRSVDKLTTQVTGLAEWQRDANGTTKRIESGLNDLTEMVKGIVVTGVTTKLNLDTNATHLATVTQESQTALLDAIHNPDHKEKA